MKIQQVITDRKHPAVTAALSHLAILHRRQQGPRHFSLKPLANCVVFICFGGLVYSNPRWGGGWLGKAALTVSARPSATSLPHEHNALARTRSLALLCCWNMKYAWTIKSIWTIYLNIRYGVPSETIIKGGWRTRPPAHPKKKRKHGEGA